MVPNGLQMMTNVLIFRNLYLELHKINVCFAQYEYLWPEYVQINMKNISRHLSVSNEHFSQRNQFRVQ